jgi:transcription antitermination factor NusG
MAKLYPKGGGRLKTLEEKRMLSKWFAYSANWFVLFVQTHQEQKVAELIQKKLDPERYVVFTPTKDYAYQKNGEISKRKVPWLDGYVFIAATVSEQECKATVKPLVYMDSDIYRLLSNGDATDSVMLSEHDKSIMTAILDENFNIPALEAVIEGDKVKIIDGSALEGFGGRVKRVNKHRQTAVIEIEMLGRIIDCEVMFEYLVKP